MLVTCKKVLFSVFTKRLQTQFSRSLMKQLRDGSPLCNLLIMIQSLVKFEKAKERERKKEKERERERLCVFFTSEKKERQTERENGVYLSLFLFKLGTDKFGNVFMSRLPPSVSDEVEEDPTAGGKFKAEGGYLNGASYRVKKEKTNTKRNKEKNKHRNKKRNK